MKKFLVVFLMLSFFLVSCSDDSKNDPHTDSDVVVDDSMNDKESVDLDSVSDEDVVTPDKDSVKPDEDNVVVTDEDNIVVTDEDNVVVTDEDEIVVADEDTSVDEDTETPDSDALITVGNMVLIPAGTFSMGSPEGEFGRNTDEIVHTVTLTKGFYMNKYEVTQGEFNSTMGYNPSSFSSCGDSCPVEKVNWYEALAYANERSKLDSIEECFDCTGTAPDFECSLKTKFAKPQDCKGYRLPTESEWEYAARANTTTAFYNGDITQPACEPLDPNLDLVGWYGGNSSSTTSEYDCSDWFAGADKCGPQPVGGKLANSYELFDMSGNVWEWNMDWYGDYPADPATDPVGAESGSSRVVRGGSWYGEAYNCRVALRGFTNQTRRDYYFGFRLARTE